MKTLLLLCISVFVLFSSMPTFAQSKGSFERGKALAREKKFKEAVEIFRDLVDANPNDAKSFSYLLWCYVELKQFEDAVDAGRKALALDASNSIDHTNFGYSLGQLGKNDEAIA